MVKTKWRTKDVDWKTKKTATQKIQKKEENNSMLEQAILLLAQWQKQLWEAIEKQSMLLKEIKEWLKWWEPQEDKLMFSAKKINEISYTKTYKIMKKIYDPEYNITSYDLPLWISFKTEQEAHQYWIENFWQWNYWITTETKPQSVS